MIPRGIYITSSFFDAPLRCHSLKLSGHVTARSPINVCVADTMTFVEVACMQNYGLVGSEFAVAATVIFLPSDSHTFFEANFLCLADIITARSAAQEYPGPCEEVSPSCWWAPLLGTGTTDAALWGAKICQRQRCCLMGNDHLSSLSAAINDLYSARDEHQILRRLVDC